MRWYQKILLAAASMGAVAVLGRQDKATVIRQGDETRPRNKKTLIADERDKRTGYVFADVDIVQALREEVAKSIPAADERGVVVRVRLPQEEAVRIFADGRAIRAAFRQVLDNAVRYNREEGLVTIELVKGPGATVRVSVTDSGMGMSEDELPYIAMNNYRARATLAGKGRGLFTARAIVAAHGGSMEITSREREGTRVSLAFPLDARRASAGGQWRGGASYTI
ncbi:MAG: HAMP domain-containing sensor histidine kinase [Candidatus Spechtbacterales bacterium]